MMTVVEDALILMMTTRRIVRAHEVIPASVYQSLITILEARHQSNPRDRRKSDPNSTRMETNSMNQLVPQTNNPGHLDDPRLNPRAHLSQENQTNNQLIQLSSISNTIGLGNLQNS